MSEDKMIFLKQEDGKVRPVPMYGRQHAVIAHKENHALKQRISELEAAQEWVSVDDRLPEHREMVIVSHNNRWQYFARLVDGDYVGGPADEYWETDHEVVFETRLVTHWQPLPPPPEAT